MAWSDSKNPRSQRLPADWQQRRNRILRRDGHTCVLCDAPANQVDHIRPGDDHSDGNLQSLCFACHARKTKQESAAARGAASRARAAARKRPVERHPGLR